MEDNVKQNGDKNGRQYITDITHYLDENGKLSPQMPIQARKVASYLILLIDATTSLYPVKGMDTKIRCKRKRCKGSIISTLLNLKSEIIWYCPICRDNGVITNWQGTEWNNIKI